MQNQQKKERENGIIRVEKVKWRLVLVLWCGGKPAVTTAMNTKSARNSCKNILFDANFYSFAMQNFQDAETTSLCWEGLQG